MEGGSRSKPSPELFSKIESKTFGLESKVFSIDQVRIIAAAVVAILILNGFAFAKFSSLSESPNQELVEDERSASSLISDFKIYE